MRINTDKIRKYLRNFDFKTLFIEELGWDHHASSIELMIDSKNYHLISVAQKRDFVAFIFFRSDNTVTLIMRHGEKSNARLANRLMNI